MSASDPVNPKRPSTTTIAPATISPNLKAEADAPGSPTSTATLCTLLKRDIEPQGQRIFIPFFRHYDLLRLSECSKDLMRYRHHLSEILLFSPHPFIRSKDSHGIVRLLSAQERGGYGLDCLVIGNGDEVELLRSAIEGCYQFRVKKLLLKSSRGISSILLSGAMRGIENLALDGSFDWQPVFEALGQGACPRLLCLSVRHLNITQCVTLAQL